MTRAWLWRCTHTAASSYLPSCLPPQTGLDARSAMVVMRAIRNVASTGRTVVCTVHQPSAELFFAFDDMLLLAPGGYVVYAGPLGRRAEALVSYLQVCPVCVCGSYGYSRGWGCNESRRYGEGGPQRKLTRTVAGSFCSRKFILLLPLRLQAIPHTLPLPPNTNPATWMLDVLSTPDPDEDAGTDAAAADAAQTDPPLPEATNTSVAAAAAAVEAAATPVPPQSSSSSKASLHRGAAAATPSMRRALSANVVNRAAASGLAGASAPPPRYALAYNASARASENEAAVTSALQPTQQQLSPDAQAASKRLAAASSHYAAPFLRQVAALSQRHWREVMRQRDFTLIRVIVFLFLGAQRRGRPCADLKLQRVFFLLCFFVRSVLWSHLVSTGSDGVYAKRELAVPFFYVCSSQSCNARSLLACTLPFLCSVALSRLRSRPSASLSRTRRLWPLSRSHHLLRCMRSCAQCSTEKRWLAPSVFWCLSAALPLPLNVCPPPLPGWLFLPSGGLRASPPGDGAARHRPARPHVSLCELPNGAS
jgi:hypothetical protein